MESNLSLPVVAMTDAESARITTPADEAGLGALRTERGNLPLGRIDIHAAITGLTAAVELTQDFVNTFDQPLEATYIFPVPDRAAVTGMRMTADGRTVHAELQERGAARQAYDDNRRRNLLDDPLHTAQEIWQAYTRNLLNP